jgi:hypothetical protein
MKVQTMRNIDKFVGVPLTFIFSIGIFIISVFQRKRKNPKLVENNPNKKFTFVSSVNIFEF